MAAATNVRQKIHVTDVAKGLIGMAPDLGTLTREGPGLLLRKPTDKMSVGRMFEKTAAKHPDRTFLKGEDHVTFTYDAANKRVNQYAHVLKEDYGVRRGDVVGIMAHSQVEYILMLLAAVKLGAIAGLLNYNQRGDVLAHSLGLLDSKVLLLEDGMQEDLATAGDVGAAQTVLTMPDLAKLAREKGVTNPPDCAATVAKEQAYYIFTSGTTGMPKASVMSHFRWLKSYSGLGALGVRLKSSDTIYCPLPLYHNNAVTVALSSALVNGSAFAVAKKFSASKFWDECIKYDATAFVYIGELCRYLLAQPAKPVDTQHKVRVIVGNGLRPDIWHEFQDRFKIKRIAEFYGASECNIAFINAFNIDQTAGTCPLPFTVVEYDPETGEAKRNDKGRLIKVKHGGTGLLLAKVSSRAPFDGYTDPAATEKKLYRNAFKDGDTWFNSGDLVHKQGHLHVSFVDRLGDTFRWKGENVATTEVEAVLGKAPGIEECTVYGVAVPGTDGKAGMGAIVLQEGADFDGDQVGKALTTGLPAYAVPLFLRVVDSLEHTSTFKSRKVELRDAGYSDMEHEVVFVLTDGKYVPYYPEYTQDVAAAKYPRI
ncbi:long-chain-acyl-CoA synthetase [Branchiibius sp. NY16-3462-2]|uniref:long-chain-acyl-CoA synthetase n=1 Tax=Branchiibius sp. NY16-3462-2 TaxID=1807500 RepID=UPI00079C596C|nr:long-chain-acyl-CoA synthetase [Branchiibius sp. NY16-3462-2]KYH43384.1 long-chain-acyl-CoA synthetase [Branchiibius sp. NY16-3462-2]